MTNNSSSAYTYELGEWIPFNTLPSLEDHQSREEWLNKCGFKADPVVYGDQESSSLLIYPSLSKDEVASCGAKIEYYDGEEGYLAEISLNGLAARHVVIHDYPNLMHFLKEYSGVALLKSMHDQQMEVLDVLDEIKQEMDDKYRHPFLFDIIDEAINPKAVYQHAVEFREQLLHGDATLLADKLSDLVSLVEEGNQAVTTRIKQLIGHLMPALVELRDKGEIKLNATAMHHYASLANLAELASRSDLSQSAREGIKKAMELLNIEENEAAQKAKGFLSKILDKVTDAAEDVAASLQQHIDKHK